MTHKIKVQMFGNFRMDYNGAPFVAEKMHKESQFNRMMQQSLRSSITRPVHWKSRCHRNRRVQRQCVMSG